MHTVKWLCKGVFPFIVMRYIMPRDGDLTKINQWDKAYHGSLGMRKAGYLGRHSKPTEHGDVLVFRFTSYFSYISFRWGIFK